jgi:5-formyltetrahydrofolate cyclo-ligase
MQKSDARTYFLNKRKALSLTECLKLDDLLLIQFQKLKLGHVNRVGSFYPMDAHNEPNVLLLAQYLKAVVPNIEFAYPRINLDHKSMDFYAETDTLSENKWGIKEPIPLNKLMPIQMDAILVPLLGFDLIGHRVGFGKGFYDRYFENYPKSHLRVGISYFEPISKLVDTQQFDVPLTHCITPWNIYEF